MTRRVLILVAALTALLAVLWFVRRPIVAGVKEWRANSLISKAEDAAAEGRDREAVQAATAAWQLGPKQIGTVRRLMIHGRTAGLPDLPSVTLVVFFHEDRSPEDREDILKWALDRGNPAFFDQLYPNLDEGTRATPTMRLLHARKLAMQGRLLEALEEARALAAEHADQTEVSLLLAELLCLLPDNPVAARQAQDRLHDLLRHEDEAVALRAWRLLPLLPAELRDPGAGFDPVAWASTHPGATGPDRVAAARMAVERLPEGERGPAMDARGRSLIGDAATAGAVVRWYLDSGRGPDLLNLPEEPFLGDATLFSSRLQVLLELDRFDEAKAWLQRAPKTFPESVAGSLEAVFLRRQGRSSEALSAWRRVIDRAANLQVFGDCLSILRVAERFGEERAAEDVVQVIVSIPPSRLPSSEQLEFLELRFAGRPGDWLAFWREIFRFRPGDAFAAEQVSFLELGEGPAVDPKPVLERTEKALRRFPTVPRFFATHALWLLRDGRGPEALALLREADLNWNEAEPLARAAYALALRANGAGGEADAMAAGIHWERIGPVRRQVLAALLKEGQPSAPAS